MEGDYPVFDKNKREATLGHLASRFIWGGGARLSFRRSSGDHIRVDQDLIS